MSPQDPPAQKPPEQWPKERRLILRLTNGYEAHKYMTLTNYPGSQVVDPELLEAVAAELARRYGDYATKRFAGVEILAEEWL